MLPKIEYPTYTIKVPSTGKAAKFRPFLVKEEKLLLMAKESQSSSDILSAVKQVVNNCSLEKSIDVNKITIFDLEYIFLKLRAYSVDNITKVAYVDDEDKKTYNFSIDLNTVEVEFPEKINNTIKINDNLIIKMRYPMASLYDDEDFLSLKTDQFFELIARCVECIAEGDEVHDKFTLEEIKEFLDKLDTKTFEAIQKFLLTVPTLKHVLEYKNSNGKDRKITLRSLNDFFSLR